MASQGPWAATGFAAGTFVQTARGLRPIERLVPGEDELEFHDGTTGPLLHLWQATFSAEDLSADEALRPVTIPALSLGGTVPSRPLVAARSARLHAQGRLVNRVTETPEVLLPVSSLLSGEAEVTQPMGELTYYHLVTDKHQVLRVEGLMCETLYLGEGADAELRSAVEAQTGPLSHKAILPRIDLETAARLTAKLAKKKRAPVEEDTA
ncbi:MAG: Hint domain-containing protein [Rhodobacteraceae bacterium]|nr:Hint domain-containing protein [Paracoccaceae bacterium]